MNKLLTISIAAYNMENYIRQTLDSLVDERVIDYLEIFVIDDGGTDRTMEIAKEYAAKYPNSIFPIHKENGGYGSTVNYSVAHATGKYLKLLDGDDWFDQDGLYDLVVYLKGTNVDAIVTPNKAGNDSDHMEVIEVKWIEKLKVVKISEMEKAHALSMYQVTYKTAIVQGGWISLPEHCFYTDVLYALYPLALARDLVCLSRPVYCYRQGRVGNTMNKKTLVRNLPQIMYVSKLGIEFYEQKKAEQCGNLNVILARVARSYINGAKAVIYGPVSKETLLALKNYEIELKETSEDVYKATEKCGVMGMIWSLFRKTHYIVYWLLKLIPGGMPYLQRSMFLQRFLQWMK